MSIIRKYPLQGAPTEVLMLPKSCRFRHIGLDVQRQICLWLEHDQYQVKIKHPIFLFGTGQEISPDGLAYLGTVARDYGVWHFYTPPGVIDISP